MSDASTPNAKCTVTCNCRRHLLQLVIFLDIAKNGLLDVISDQLGGSNLRFVVLNETNKWQVVYQEINPTETDVTFLHSLNVIVLGNPEAQRMIDENSFVFTPCCPAGDELLARSRTEFARLELSAVHMKTGTKFKTRVKTKPEIEKQ